MLRRLAVLALAVAVAACGSDDDGPDIASPDQLALRIVSGDGQRAPVADAGGSVSAAFTPAQTIPEGILPEPLVARITVDGQAPSAAVAPSGPLGPSLAVIPPNTVVTFRTIQPEGVGARHCGASFVDAGIPDDSGYVITYWERGTYAGECRTEVRLIVDGVPRVDTVFTATFEPGPVATIPYGSGQSGPSPLYISDWSAPKDLHGNRVPFTVDLNDHPTANLLGDSGKDAETLVAEGDGCAPVRILAGDTLIGLVEVRTHVDTNAMGDGWVWIKWFHPDAYYGCGRTM